MEGNMLIEESSPKLENERLILRRFEVEDLEDFYELYSNETVNTFIPMFPLTSKEEALEFMKDNYIKYYDQENTYRYAIVLKENKKVIGAANVSEGDSHDLGYLLLENYWNKGYASEAVMLIVDHLINIGIPYITSTHDVNNPASGKVMINCGLKYKYSYTEQWQPKDKEVNFRMYQLNVNQELEYVYMKYWNMYPHFIEAQAFKEQV